MLSFENSGPSIVSSLRFTCFTLAQRKDYRMVETRPLGCGWRLFFVVGLSLSFSPPSDCNSLPSMITWAPCPHGVRTRGKKGQKATQPVSRFSMGLAHLGLPYVSSSPGRRNSKRAANWAAMAPQMASKSSMVRLITSRSRSGNATPLKLNSASLLFQCYP